MDRTIPEFRDLIYMSIGNGFIRYFVVLARSAGSRCHESIYWGASMSLMSLRIRAHEVVDALQRSYLPAQFRTLAFEGAPGHGGLLTFIGVSAVEREALSGLRISDRRVRIYLSAVLSGTTTSWREAQ
jgi:hypothetical protein